MGWSFKVEELWIGFIWLIKVEKQVSGVTLLNVGSIKTWDVDI
jgi:hypothetical protein